ncbi:MAG: hypothetical protein QF570_09630 [Myxococcota bacterium]|jgi:flagellar motility protein MotE (MotC chaperone)|nr:hypothetical protein [Myxococcota bacterium]
MMHRDVSRPGLAALAFAVAAAISVAPVSAQDSTSNKDAEAAAEPDGREASGRASMAGSRMGLSQGVDRLLIEVHKRQKELTEAEREVVRREAAVLELEVMIEERIAALEADRAAIEERITAWEVQDGDRIKKLSRVYSAMPPARAARLLSDLELDLAVSVLGGMKQKESAKVLAVIDPKRALVLSRRLARPLATD